jgi:hypothetical protein
MHRTDHWKIWNCLSMPAAFLALIPCGNLAQAQTPGKGHKPFEKAEKAPSGPQAVWVQRLESTPDQAEERSEGPITVANTPARVIQVQVHEADARPNPSADGKRRVVEERELHEPSRGDRPRPPVSRDAAGPDRAGPPRRMNPPALHAPPTGQPGGRPPFAFAMARPAGDDLETQFKALDRLMESPTVKQMLQLMQENVELRAQMEIQKIEMRYQAELNELRAHLQAELGQAERTVAESHGLRERSEREIHEAHAARQELMEVNHRLERELEARDRENQSLREERHKLEESFEQRMHAVENKVNARVEEAMHGKAELEHRARLLEAKLQDMERALDVANDELNEWKAAARRNSKHNAADDDDDDDEDEDEDEDEE